MDEKKFLMGSDVKKDDEPESPKKRTLEEALGINEDGSTKKLKDAQTVGTKGINVPVDETCPLRGNRHQLLIKLEENLTVNSDSHRIH